MNPLPVTHDELREGISELQSAIESSETHLSGVRDLPFYEDLLARVQMELQSKLPELLVAAISPDVEGIELVDETSTQYRFRVKEPVWKELQNHLALTGDDVDAVISVHLQRLPTNDDWLPLLVQKPELYRNGIQAMIAELQTLRDQGMDFESAFQYLLVKHNIADPSDPFADGWGDPESEVDLGGWSVVEALQGQEHLRRTPSESD